MTAPHLTTSSPQTRDDVPAEGQRPKSADAERLVLGAAGIVIVVLTAGAFWLSYAHLADVAGQHGLGASPMRRWAWPATLDAFIVAGELLMLRAALRRTTDLWAVAVTVAGSVGSIALNVAGVSGADSERSVPLLDYVVAAVPPAAAMVAFGVLMRQIHQLVAPTDVPSGIGSIAVRNRPVSEHGEGRRQDAATEVPQASGEERTESTSSVPKAKPVGGRPPKATIAELKSIGRAAGRQHGKLTRGLLRAAVKERNLTIGSARQTEVMESLRPELEAAGIKVSGG
ncbi:MULTISPECIES: DUF2637 domain-containing protein [Streptomyces]|uniref:DUF2637 domain-containing protein n=1 Tax=Streptomyces TaxID=1883 RepID=UPI00093E668C|nr:MULTISPECIES: DUF2637 domain-containing protein [unclassified Streptomyces]OKJ14895.1 hypothetical protein AMK20_03640 [Streptomyces sp. TSRI0261]QNQ34909.1 DUF2637 domain-containing protein [Streptomyces sp. CB00271]